MSTKSCCIRSCRTVARHLGIATALLAAIGLAPVRAVAADDSTDPSVTQPPAPEQQQQELDSQGAAVSDPGEGQDVRAAYQEQSGEAKASRVEAQEDASTVHVMAPTDPDWSETHSGG